MLDRLYYTLTEAEEILQTSRDGLKRLERRGLLVMHGQNHGKRVTGASLRSLADRIAQGEDIWAVVKQNEDRARSEAKPMAKARSTKTNKAAGGTSHQQKTGDDSPESEPLTSNPRSWLEPIT